MAILDILAYPDPKLKQESLPVEQFDESLRSFVSDLEETMRAGPGGVGIAAPQVGYFQRIVIVDCSVTRKPVPNNGTIIMINPEITDWEGMAKGREGCMSVPDYTGNVIRAEKIKFQAYDLEGELHEYESEGFEARAVQHEMDHLDGMLFLDRLVSRRNDLFKRKVYQKK
ncbi:peptide deformylase [Solemya pervernicosa gill symbiont]|uniref:Peptide deformylase n=2 Tax=Gammaproteobacteria incertae sedis TaxID=118884 RepID=A0A1T2L613_9GAMM|nr:peptide deformylase [Candidatus Reidiella endopervernicosa]OOZ40521.1 peptide deformylase [Solemya pervernicosa gill symbiont]QKQ27507.1 peptide deformylase [Candidatus Reidiella endopervernicosa]